MEATKYRAEADAKEGYMDTGFLWLTKENIPVRMEAHVKRQDSQLVVTYTNIKTGEQDAALFEIPPSYHKMDLSARPGHAASPVGRPTDEQMQQRLKQTPGK